MVFVSARYGLSEQKRKFSFILFGGFGKVTQLHFMEKIKKPNLEKFKMAIFKSGLKKIEIAEKMGISNGHLVNMLHNKNPMNEEKRAKLNEILNTNI